MTSILLTKRARRFAISGVIATAIHVIVATAFMEMIWPDPRVANATAFAVATLSSYSLNTLWSFSAPLSGRTFRRFILVALSGCALAAVVSGIVEYHGYPYGAGIALVVLTVPPVTFFLHSGWTYR